LALLTLAVGGAPSHTVEV